MIIDFVKKHKNISIIFSLFFILFTYFGLNYSGMCISQMRWLSDEEKIRLAVDRVNSREFTTVTPNRILVTRVPYKSIDDFIEKNSECCGLGPPVMTSEGTFPDFSFWDQKIWGFGGAHVGGKFDQIYTKDDINILSEMQWMFVKMTNCGRIF